MPSTLSLLLAMQILHLCTVHHCPPPLEHDIQEELLKLLKAAEMLTGQPSGLEDPQAKDMAQVLEH